jgi:hypothetical protein
MHRSKPIAKDCISIPCHAAEVSLQAVGEHYSKPDQGTVIFCGPTEVITYAANTRNGGKGYFGLCLRRNTQPSAAPRVEHYPGAKFNRVRSDES